MLFKKLVKQHRIHGVVAHGIDLAFVVAHHQVRADLRYFLGDKPVLRRVRIVTLVVERHRVEAKDSFASFVHRCDLFFEPARGADRAQLVSGVDYDWYGVSVVRCLPANLANKAAAADVRA